MDYIKTPFPEHPLDTASRLVGGRKVLADRLGVSVAAIGNWKFRGVPFDQCMPIETATNGAVTRCVLRPEDHHIHWPELALGQEIRALAAIENVAVQGA